MKHSKHTNHKLWALLVALIALVALCAFAANAEIVGGDCGQYGDNVTWSYDTETKVLTISGEGEITDSPWLQEYQNTVQESVQSIVIEEGITRITVDAFEYCSALTNISLPSTLEECGNSIFHHCFSLESITIPENLTTAPSLFSSGSDISNLKNVTFTDGLTRIDKGMFLLTQLEDIVIPSSIESIGTLAFACPHIKTVRIGTGLKNIGYAAMNTDMWKSMSGGALDFSGPDIVYTCMTEEEWNENVTIDMQATSDTYSFGNVNYPECNWVPDYTIFRYDSHLPGEPVQETVPANGATPAHTANVTYCSLCGREISREIVIPPIEHTHTFAATWTWSEDGTMANAVVACTGCDETSSLLNAEITREAQADGSILCTASVTYEGETFTDTKIVQTDGTLPKPQPIYSSDRCSMCSLYEKYKGKGFIGLIISLVHTFVHLASQIGAR